LREADGAAGAADIDDGDLPAELAAEMFGDDARLRVGAAAGRERHDQADRMVRVIALRGSRCDRAERGRERGEGKFQHVVIRSGQFRNRACAQAFASLRLRCKRLRRQMQLGS
jgi:hypothetical protein